MSSQDTPLTGTGLGPAQLRRHKPFDALGQGWTWHILPSPSDAKRFTHCPARAGLPAIPRSEMDPALQGLPSARRKAGGGGNMKTTGLTLHFQRPPRATHPDWEWPNLTPAAAGRGSSLGAVPSPQSIPQPLLPRVPRRAARRCSCPPAHDG